MMRKLRWYQFSLRQIFAVMFLASVVCAVYYTFWLRPHQIEQAAIRRIQTLGGTSRSNILTAVITDQAKPEEYAEYIPYDMGSHIVHVDLSDCDDADAVVDVVTRLPHLKTLAVGGENFADAHLIRLTKLQSLDVLVLDCTSVTDAGILKFKGRVPKLLLWKSSRRAIEKTEKVDVLFGDLFPFVEYIWSEANDTPRLQYLVDDLLYDRVLILEIFDACDSHFGAWLEIIINDDSSLAALKYLPDLRWLILQGPCVTDTGLGNLKYLPKDCTLTIRSDTRVTEKGLQALRGLSNIDGLNISTKNLSTLALEPLTTMPNLHWLELDDVKINDRGIEYLEKMIALKYLVLPDAEMDAESIIRLRNSLPNCEITIDGEKYERLADEGKEPKPLVFQIP